MTRTPTNEDDTSSLAELAIGLQRALAEDRGARAELRRCHTTTEVMLTPGFHRFRRQLGRAGHKLFQPRVAALVGVLAHVSEHDGGRKLGAQLAQAKGGENAALTGLRFRRLIACQDPDELYRGWLRAARLVGGRLNSGDLAERLAYWGDRARRELAQEYYDAAPNED